MPKLLSVLNFETLDINRSDDLLGQQYHLLLATLLE